MLWRGVLCAFFILWIQDIAECDEDVNTCSFYYWRVDWKKAVKTCEREDKQLLCYKSKKEINDIIEAFQLAAFGTSALVMWLSSRNCSSNEGMTECLSLHIQKGGDSIWHFIQEECGEKYPFVCCINETGRQTTWIDDYSTAWSTTNWTSDIFDITDSTFFTSTNTASTLTSPFCKKIRKRGIFWPDTNAGETAYRPCPGNSSGQARWACERTNNGEWRESGPDMKNCRSLEIENLKNRFNTTSATDMISELEHIFGDRNKEVFGEDLADIISLMTALPDRLFYELENLTNSAMWPSTKDSAEKAMSIIDRMVELNATWHDIDKEEKSKTGTNLLSTVEGMGSLLAYAMLNNTKELSMIGKNIALQVMKPKYGEAVSMPQWVVTSGYSHRGNILLEKGYDSRLKSGNENMSIVFALYTDMSNILSPSEKNADSNEASSLNSAVLSATVTQNRKTQRIKKRVTITMEHLTQNPNQTACVFWNMNHDRWDTSGCRLITSNVTHSVCSCDHLTNFALLMDYGDMLKDIHQLPFHYITLVGCSLSIVCLAFCVIIFSCYSYYSRHSWSLRYVIHRNLCLTLLIANLILVIGLDRTENQRSCAITAGLLHYFFLAAFCWMLLEGIHIYLLLVVVFASRRSHSERYYIFGYGFPLIVVIITAASRPSYYGTDEICWLSAEKGTIWGFLGPIAVILILNLAALILAQYKASKISVKNDKVALIKRWLRVTLILFPVLGITWIFGFLYLGKYFEVAGYLFAVFNSFQGVCIFVFHCLMDKKARNLVVDSFRKQNSSVNTGSSGTQKKMKDQPQNGIKTNSITPVENDNLNRVSNAFHLPNPKDSKTDWWIKCRKPWSFCFEMPVSSKNTNSQKEQEKPQAVIVKWNSLGNKNCS